MAYTGGDATKRRRTKYIEGYISEFGHFSHRFLFILGKALYHKVFGCDITALRNYHILSQRQKICHIPPPPVGASAPVYLWISSHGAFPVLQSGHLPFQEFHGSLSSVLRSCRTVRFAEVYGNGVPNEPTAREARPTPQRGRFLEFYRQPKQKKGGTGALQAPAPFVIRP